MTSTAQHYRAKILSRRGEHGWIYLCQDCGKRAYDTQRTAERIVLTAKFRMEPGRRIPLRAYLGECGWWHTTSREEDDG